MSPAKLVVPRRVAARDIEAVRDAYLRDAGRAVAAGFLQDPEAAFARIAAHPASGSPRYAYELERPELRMVPLRRYPHLVFHVEEAEAIDVLRVLHARRDIPSWLQTGQG